jgi:hydroxyacylglutathione hydrolase
MNLVALPAFADNYIWMLHDGREALVVDPGEATPVLNALHAQRLTLSIILVTHHHMDHVGGVDDLRAALQGQVHGPATESIPAPYVAIQGGSQFTWRSVSVRVLDVPGHTAGHVAYVVNSGNDSPPILFCGDTLFSGGCGRLFEGTAEQMHQSLQRLSTLPDDTLVCCAHEYTLANLRFAEAVEPDNAELVRYREHGARQRAAGKPTLPSSLALERQINPFLRCDQPAVIAAALQRGATGSEPVQVFTALRQWKNTFQ